MAGEKKVVMEANFNEESTMIAPDRVSNLPVIRQMQDLTTNPVCTKAKGKNDVDEVRYETANKIFVARGGEYGLPRPNDVPVFMFVLEALQAQQDIAKGVAKKTGIAFDYKQHMSLRIRIDDVLALLGRKAQTNSRKAIILSLKRYKDTNIDIIYRGEAKRKRIRAERPHSYSFSMIGVAPSGNMFVDVSFVETYFEALEGLDKKEVRHLALDHVIHLSGTATQLYSILAEQLGHKNAHNEYRIAARTLARKLFGEKRGGDKKKLPTSRFYTPFVTNAIDEIAKKTGWKIGAEKTGRGENADLIFWTQEIRRDNVKKKSDAVPNAWEVAKAAKRQREKVAAEARPDRGIRFVGDKLPDEKKIPKQVGLQAPALADEILALLPEVSRTDNTVATILSGLNLDHATALLDHCRAKSADNPVGYLIGISRRNDNIQSVAEECLKKAPKMAERKTLLERRLNHSIEKIVKEQVSNGRDREWLEAECQESDIPIEKVDRWIADNHKLVSELRDKLIAKEKAKHKEARRKELIEVALDGLSYEQRSGVKQTAEMVWQNDDRFINEACLRHKIKPETVLAYMKAQGWDYEKWDGTE